VGYSARYHAASIAAVFLALAIGILIGAEFGDDVVSGTSRSLEESLQGDLDEARGSVDQLEAQLAREREFGELAYPVLVGGRLEGQRVGLVAFGDLPEELGEDVEAALEPTGAELATVAVVDEPPELAELSIAAGPRFARLRDDDDSLEAYGRAVGRQLVRGGALLRQTEDELFSRLSGRPSQLDGVVVARSRAETLTPEEAAASARLEAGILDGIASSSAPAVGVERTDAERSSIAVFADAGLATVDHVDLVAGEVSLVLALRGAKGNFGVKDSADQLLPDVLPSSSPIAP